MENKISEKVANDQLNILKDYYEFEIDDLPESLKESVEYAIKKITGAIQKGRIEIVNEDTLKVVQTLKHGDNKLTYESITGKAKSQMKDKDSQYDKIYSLLGSLSGWGKPAIQSLSGIDLSTAESLGLILLQV